MLQVFYRPGCVCYLVNGWARQTRTWCRVSISYRIEAFKNRDQPTYTGRDGTSGVNNLLSVLFEQTLIKRSHYVEMLDNAIVYHTISGLTFSLNQDLIGGHWSHIWILFYFLICLDSQ
jgi:hypothetical protein